MSTMAVFPDGVQAAFATAADLGFDGIEIMVWSDPASRDARAVAKLSRDHGVPVLSVHAPTTLLTQGVWGRDPWERLRRSAEHAEALGADVVVVHPPFRWQREYGAGFADGIARLGEEHHVDFAVENMFPWRVGTSRLEAYSPGWDPTHHEYEHVTLDFSHAATAQLDSLDLAHLWGRRVRHVHLGDGSGSVKDEHLPPGRGNQPVAEVLEHLRRTGWRGHVMAEVNTRRAGSRRAAVLAETLAFARTHLGQAWRRPAGEAPAPVPADPGAP
ncbi:MAG: sugar phosphate isomerase/epimerase family protein [Kineosporiaceae bacterium]